MKKTDTNFQPWEKSFDKIMTPFEEFIHEETTSGLILMMSAILAMFLANSFLSHHYEHILHTELAISLGGMGELRYTLHHWINDGLMAFFFLVVGLEIKREVIVGELSDPKAAMMPIIAAIGGMLVPAMLFFFLNINTDAATGWGVPMATDIAFAVGVLVLLGSRVPRTVLTFLVGLAIVDDLGAVVVIALFYTEQIFINWLALAIISLIILVIFNRMGIRKPLPYFIVGTILWFAMLQSGVHATLAGVLVALTIPVKPKFDHTLFVDHMSDVLNHLKASQNKNNDTKNTCIIHDNDSRAMLQTLENGVHSVESPLQRLEHAMHMPVAFIVIPLFALANAGIPVDISTIGQTLSHPVALGVMAGLILGKLIGVAGITWLAIKFGLGKLPEGMTGHHLIGVGFLAGIGFTMSIFIAELGFANNSEYLLMAKTGVLFASIIAGTCGYLWLRLTAKNN
ncbi:MAG: Na+/H+ antiporter NhaA [gamma proteobacterium symbiont of Bathyaustriella thionipta]|nr:Na+/H+ antiporter NhaA [gamma proteobacterium symbiont of Bathyaustriella thionipta]MCU7949162.1 Na+/H+ antiporter NhaA [gamma proteobacterium symbiont of Bathyaustriella thionipta]MCU7953358.1 Na+/H+ antiporter NhaA [gamma proteobacterium symbiont of Bathyaustriella thionipta]MCU7955742.1 Na+/H+ antiporter NhaA [gamma proteobacterium symbiont of Bathyaustriella thionipta]MCU7965639.1 Na+/H+ antiporter NhaA [gamma proteobacterium symbiont of Bathyaustriella thionipta]